MSLSKLLELLEETNIAESLEEDDLKDSGHLGHLSAADHGRQDDLRTFR